MTELPIIARASLHPERSAFVGTSDVCTYGELLQQSRQLASLLIGDTGDLGESRAAMLIPTGRDYAAAQWGIWRSGASHYRSARQPHCSNGSTARQTRRPR
ncbi:MAG UNVERIFIED_CONTAM: hypothetical protein LVR18_15130 [Planctomycetaceae bacterium]